MYIHKHTGIPIVFDYHHHQFCTGGLTEEEALKLAATTWPDGITQEVHYSESKALHENNPKEKPQAHSIYINSLPNTYGLDVDIMVEFNEPVGMDFLRLAEELETLKSGSMETNLEIVTDLHRWGVEQIFNQPDIHDKALELGRTILGLAQTVPTLESMAGNRSTRANDRGDCRTPADAPSPLCRP
jgi:hypothetical protein